jgi:hypothetical protein
MYIATALEFAALKLWTCKREGKIKRRKTIEKLFKKQNDKEVDCKREK